MIRSRILSTRNGTTLMLLCLLVLAGCSAQGAQFNTLPTLGQGEAMITVYRPSAFGLSGAWPDIHVDGQKRGELKNGGYLLLRVPPGGHLVEMKGPITRWDIRAETLSCKPDIKAGETAFIKMLITSTWHPLGLRTTVTFKFVNRDTAIQELSSLSESK